MNTAQCAAFISSDSSLQASIAAGTPRPRRKVAGGMGVKVAATTQACWLHTCLVSTAAYAALICATFILTRMESVTQGGRFSLGPLTTGNVGSDSFTRLAQYLRLACPHSAASARTRTSSTQLNLLSFTDVFVPCQAPISCPRRTVIEWLRAHSLDCTCSSLCLRDACLSVPLCMMQSIIV